MKRISKTEIKEMRSQSKKNRIMFAFTLPTVILYTIFFLVTMLIGVYYSFTDWNGISKDYTFVGLKNYVKVLTDERFREALWFNIGYTIALVVLLIVIPLTIALALGLVYSSKEKIYQSYNEALYALNQRLIQGWNRAYFYKNMDGYKARIGKEAEIKLESIVRTRKEKEINQVIHSILEDIIIKEESAQKLYMAVVEILKILGNYYAELYQDEDIEELKDIKVMFSRRYDLYKFKHIEELENYLKEMVIVICSGKENTKKKSKIVEEIVHYVENNYYKNISLRELAENKYFVNYSYCSRLFSQETGMNFSKYLIQYRLKKAKTLLENKDMKISFIAFEVGYNDVSHFIQSFKKSYGLTPEEYRARKKIE